MNSVFADNGVAIDLDQADDIELKNVTIVGQTSLYRDIVTLQGSPSVCSFQDELVGIEMHTFVRRAGKSGAVVSNTTFAGFDYGTCGHVAHVKLDDDVSAIWLI